MGGVLGVVLMGMISYVVAESLIDSKDVVYEDNSNLAAKNVQDAIDGTCSKIDTRLSGIEDKLYTVSNMFNSRRFTSSTGWAYTGLSAVLPANSYCSITYWIGWSYGLPNGILVSGSPTVGESNSLAVSQDSAGSSFQKLSVSLNEYVGSQPVTRYIWAKFDNATENDTGYWGFCATKYK